MPRPPFIPPFTLVAGPGSISAQSNQPCASMGMESRLDRLQVVEGRDRRERHATPEPAGRQRRDARPVRLGRLQHADLLPLLMLLAPCRLSPRFIQLRTPSIIPMAIPANRHTRPVATMQMITDTSSAESHRSCCGGG